MRITVDTARASRYQAAGWLVRIDQGVTKHCPCKHHRKGRGSVTRDENGLSTATRPEDNTVSNRYVYGVVDAADALEFETDAVAGAEQVYSIRHRRLAAVVSSIETTDPERTDEDATRHDEVLREVLDAGHTVVPMRFGMVFESDRALKNVLRGARPAFRQAMRDVDGRIELGVKVVRGENDEVDETAVDEAVGNELEPIADASIENDRFSDRLVLNRSYLVPRDERESFDEAVAELEDAHEELTFRYTGPFAPYSFVDIHVGAR